VRAVVERLERPQHVARLERRDGARGVKTSAWSAQARDATYVALVSDVWNHNTHYHQVLLGLLPRGRSTALDVGAGDGRFAALLARRYSDVVALDPDRAQVLAATERCRPFPNVTVHQDDFLQSGLPDGHFDVVTALASFHHMPFAEAASEAVRVLKPGGRLIVLGVWSDDSTPGDLVLNAAASVLHHVLVRRRGRDAMNAPATLQRTSWRDIRRQATAHLPGSRLRRRLLWRYTLVWDKPPDT
jgi:SAM-dependent methyltransferase